MRENQINTEAIMNTDDIQKLSNAELLAIVTERYALREALEYIATLSHKAHATPDMNPPLVMIDHASEIARAALGGVST